MNSYTSLLRQPDSILVQTQDSAFRFEEADGKTANRAEVLYTVEHGVGKVVLLPSDTPVKRIKLRWRQDESGIISVLGDDWERTSANLFWHSPIPHKSMPWYFMAQAEGGTHGYGVKTGCRSFASFQIDTMGITLWLDVRNGGNGVELHEPLTAAEVVCREGKENENAYHAARAFCRMMCDSPALPPRPVFGVNNWYWAYGDISHESIISETEYLKEMTAGCALPPYMVLDDGWQSTRYKSMHGTYNGGPWDSCCGQFHGMDALAADIREKGALPGIWFRPLLTAELVLPEVECHKKLKNAFAGVCLDPSHPFTLERVRKDTERIAKWGYALIKHDFSTEDALGETPSQEGWNFYDRTRTSAEIIAELYRTIQNAAGDSLVIGCNTINHLSAGIHQIQRIGNDISGRSFEWTRRFGINSMMRLPQNRTFFSVDPDCAAFTARVSHDLNLDFMEAMARTGVTLFASVTPHSLTSDEFNRINSIYRMASEPGRSAEPLDFDRGCCPCRFADTDGIHTYDWYREYDGSRQYLSWMN